MKNNIRWLLTEAKISELNTNVVNYENGKLIGYHLTSHEKWSYHNEWVKERLKNPIIKYPKQKRSKDDDRAARILKNLKDANRFSTVDTYDIEESVIMDLIDDPYTDTSGFKAGGGKYHGKGLYTCYRFNPAIASVYGDICLVFEVDISNFVIFSEDLAKKVHGEKWTVRDQLIKLYSQQTELAENLDEFKRKLDELEVDKFILNKDINDPRPEISTSDYSQKLLFGLRNETKCIYDGIILFGRGDGPVCVSFYPKYDAKLIGLGRVNKERPEDVDWYDSLDDFLGGRAKLKQDFETINAIAEENADPQEKYDYIKSAKVCRSGWRNLALYYKNGEQSVKEKIINYPELIDDIKTEMLFKAITDKEVNVESETYDILLEIIAENIKMTGANVLKALSKILAIINRKVPDAIILKAAAEIKHFDIDTENIKPVQHFMSHISKFDYSSIPAVQDAINKIQDKMNKIINIVEIQFNKYLDSLEANKASQALLSIYNVFHDDNIKYYIKNQSKEWKNNLIKLVVQNVKNNPKFKKIKGMTARGLGVITGFPGVNINKEDQLTLLYASGNNACFLLTNPTIDQAAYKEYLSYAIDKDYRKATIGIRESINLFKILYQDREFLKKFIEKCSSTDFRFFITEFINLLKGNSDLEVDHFWTLSEDISYRMKLSDIIDANNIEWFEYLTETARTITNSGQTKRSAKLFKELDSIVSQKNVSQEVSEPQLDLQHRKIIGNSLKEVYRL